MRLDPGGEGAIGSEGRIGNALIQIFASCAPNLIGNLARCQGEYDRNIVRREAP